MIVAAIAYVATPRPALDGTSASPAVLAVLPVLSFNVDDNTDAIGAGITATVFANLSGTSALNVIPLIGSLAIGGHPESRRRAQEPRCDVDAGHLVE